jgi:predicted 3-demethylubiquinone-9 3-methyltransferase (glyoxalase superfamily)
MDGPPGHAFTITPAASLFVGCADAAAVGRALAALSEGSADGPGDDGLSTKVAWVSDQFGVWEQLHVAHGAHALDRSRRPRSGCSSPFGAAPPSRYGWNSCRTGS